MKYQITINGKARTIDDVKFNAHAGAIADAYPDATILVSGGKSMSMNDFVRNRGRYSPQGVAGTVQSPVQRKVRIAPILPSYGIDTSTDAFGNKRNAGPTKISGKDLYGDIKENIAQRGYENVKKAQDEMVRKVADDPGAIEKYLDSKVEMENEKASDRTTQRLEQVGSYGIPSSIANSVMKRASVIEEKDPSVIARNVIDSVTDDPVVAQFIQTSMSGANDDKSRKARAERAGQLVAQRIAQSAQKKWTTVPKSDLEYGIYNAINSSIIGNLMNAGANSIARPIEGGYSGNMLDDNALNDYGEKKASWGTKLASQIGGFMLDSPIFGASMTAGNSIVSGATRIFMGRAAEGVGKEVSKAAAKAALNSTLGRKMLSNAIGMGIGGSIYGTISEGSRQVRTGQIDLPELGHGAVREFLTFSSIGWINPLTGNMLGKIASPTGKVATKAASFLGESTLFPVVGWIDRARNGENIDYVDDWVNSAAFLGTMKGMSHIGSPRSIVRNIADTYGRGVKPDNVLTENDRIQLREAGYTKINDYFNDISRRISEKDGVSVDNGLITFNKNPLINEKEVSDVLSSDRISQETKSKVASLMFGKALGMRPIVEYTRDGNDFKAYDEKGGLVIYRRAEKDPDKYEDSMRMATAKSKLDIINETDMHAAYDNAMYIVADQQGIDAESLAKRMEDPSDHISDMVTNVARKIFDENRTIRNIASENELADIFNSRKSMSAIQFAKVADTQRKIDEAYSALTRKDVPDTEGRDVMPTEETETPNVEDGAIEETEPKSQRVRPVLEDVSQYDKSMFDILSETHSDGNIYRVMLDNGEYGYVKKGDGTKAIDRKGEEWDIPADAERTPVQAEEFMRQASGARELLYGEDGKLITKPEQKNEEQTDSAPEQAAQEDENTNDTFSFETDAKGVPLYHKYPFADTYSDLESKGMGIIDIIGYCDVKRREAASLIEKIEKKQYGDTDPNKYMEIKREKEAKIAEANKMLDYWSEIKRFATAGRKIPPSSGYRPLDEARIEMIDSDMVSEILDKSNLIPKTVEEEVAAFLRHNKIMFKDEDIGHGRIRGILSQTGLRPNDLNSWRWFSRKRKNGGLSAEKAGELIELSCREDEIPLDANKINIGLNALIDFISSHKGSDVKNFIIDNRIEQARKMYEDEKRYEEDQMILMLEEDKRKADFKEMEDDMLEKAASELDKNINFAELENDIAEEYSNGIKQEDKGSASMVEPAQSDTSERMEGIEKPQPRGSSEDVRTSDKPQGTIREGRESEDGRGLEEKPAEARESERDTEQPKDDVSKEDTSDQPTLSNEYNNEDYTLFREVTDKKLLDKLDNEAKIKVYRSVQLDDNGELRSPIANGIKGGKGTATQKTDSIMFGVWEMAEEHPELINEKGRINLNKGNGNGTLEVAYNPYIHTSRSMINDQFSSAWKRDNIRVIETEIPESELSSKYKADKAKDHVGEHKWKSGPVGRKLPKERVRKVILSRYDKPLRFVSWEEVAEDYAKTLKDTNIEVPFNVIPKELLPFLVEKRIKISKPEKGNAGKASMETYEEWKKNTDIRFSEKTSDVKDSVLNHIDISDTAQSMSEKYGTSVKIVRTKDEITNQEALDAVESGRNIKGWYEPKTGDVVIYEPNATSIDDVTATYLHEVVGHKGMRGIIGEDNYGRYCDAVYKSMSEADRKIFGKSDRRKSADEYIASLAERGTSLNAWRRLVGMTRDFLRKYIDLDVCEADVEYMIWRSAKHLSGEDNTALFAVRDRVMRSIADNAREVYSAVRASIAPQPEDIMKEATQEQNDMINQSSNPVKTTALFRIPLSASEKRTEDLHNATGKRKLNTKAYDKLFNRDYELDRLATEMIRDKIIDPSRNFYNAWNQKNSIASSRVEKFKSGIDSDFLQAYNNLVHRMGGKNHQDEINFYTTVRTALERQRKIADRERQKTDNYREKDYAGITYLVKELCERKGIELPQTYDSGKGYAMDMSLALQVLGESPIDALEKYAVDFEERYSPEKLWDSIHKVTDFNLENQLDGGLISEDAYQLLRYGVKFKDIVTDMEKYAELTVAERNNIDYLIEKGIIPKGDYNRYYEYYLPLKGDDGVTMEDYYDYEQNGTTGIGTVHSVKGHTNKARMPLQILRSDASRTIANAEKNKVLQEIFVTLGANPSRDRWSTSSMYLVPDNDGYRIWRNDGTDIIPPVIKRDSVTGAEIRTNVPDTKDAIAMGSTNVIKDANFEHSSNRLLHRVGLKINGSTKEIWFADKRIADILNENFSDKKVMNNKVMKLWSSLQHGYGSLMTSFSPEFAINNTFKDKRSGFKYIATKYGLGNGVIEYNKNWYAAHAAINRHFWLTRKIQNILTLGRLSEASKYDQYLKEYMEEGGATAVNQLGSRIPEMENFIRDARGATKTGRLWEGLKKFLTSISEYSELQGRLAVYATSRGLGIDKRTAMQDSKEATANFDQRGEWNSVIGSFDLFFNAKMQGVRRTWELYKAAEKTGDEKKKQRLRLAAVLGEQVLESLLRKAVYGMAMAWYYDDKDYQNMDFIDRFKYGLYTYENISSELRTRNLMYFIPGTDMIGRISLPPEEIALNRIGEYLSDVVMPSGMQRDLWYQGRFRDTMLDALADMGAEYGDTSIGNIIDNYHLWDDYRRPWFSNLTILNSQLTKPIVETIDNKDFTNRKFYNDNQYSNSLYSYEKSYYQVSDLANRISEASGDKINAYWLDHLVKGYAPGVLQIPVDVVSSIIGWSELDKDSPDYEKDKSRAIHNTPVLRMFIHSKSVNGVNKGNDRDLFYSVRKRFKYGLQNSHKKSRADKSREELELEHLLKVYDANMKASRNIPKDEKLYRKRADEYIGVFLDKAEKYYKEGKIKLD